ncbi:MAG: hypothetical protein LAN84_08440 [Acidobacteriia bacterium]|nr:hypothetical protein [Terriglobia bacterium]
MAYLKRLADGSLASLPRGSARLGDIGWTVRMPGYPSGPEVTPAGHEQITMNAIGPAKTISFPVGGRPVSVKLSAPEIGAIIAGNRSVDLGWYGTGTAFAFKEEEQRRHSLRRNYGQNIADALCDIVGSLRAQHRGILAEANPLERMRKIGQALHLVQDSYSPAHTQRRSDSAWCIEYIRNFGRGGLPLVGSDKEHRVPSDERDKIAYAKSKGAARKAEDSSRRYLQIVLKAIVGRANADPAAGSESAADFERFLGDILRLCGRSAVRCGSAP